MDRSENASCFVLVLAWFLFAGGGSWAAEAQPQALPEARPEAVGMSSERLAKIDAVVQYGLSRDRMPGCVIMVGRNGKIVFHKAYGRRRIEPSPEAMTTDTLFDMASLTKPIATATSIMRLVEEGKIDLHSPVAKYIPEFGDNGKQKITIKQLLTHVGGLIPDNSIRDYDDGPDKAFQRIYKLKPYVEPGSKFIYTDVGFIVLADVVKRVSGKDVHTYSQENIFLPLGMTETGYLPRPELRERAATTEKRDGKWMRGQVHDPRAFRLGGVAGHAGLFSSSRDLAKYADMMLRSGSRGGVRILRPETVELMTQRVDVGRGYRALGWDSKSGYSSNRGDLMSDRAFGHGGFTGTSLWMDPAEQLFVLFLSNRVHPNGKGSMNDLAGRIAAIAGAAISRQQAKRQQPEPQAEVLTGVDVMQRSKFARLTGKRVGLITNHTGRNTDGQSTLKLLFESHGVNLVSVFSPEHGLEGKLDIANISDTSDKKTGLKIHSLYGKSRTPSAESMKEVDVLVFDIQDIGARFYTYVSTMGNAMQAAAEHQVEFIVLDRPNPIGGLDVEGPVLDEGDESFVGFHPIPVRHGMTVGELSLMIKSERKLKLKLDIVPVEGWRRSDHWDSTGLTWVNPSPNMRSLTQALLYPGIGLIETTNVSVGRGTNTPFEVIGAPWIDGRELAKTMNQAKLSGVRFVPIRFTPESSKHKAEACGGVNVIITNRRMFHSLRTGIELARTLRLLYPKHWNTTSLNRLLSSQKTLAGILEGKSTDAIQAAWQAELNDFRKRREAYLLYE
jgi:uncharacterized protein YbbC (DUF1343 family)/CubicO group peptidase (beta-lactamase class C family)